MELKLRETYNRDDDDLEAIFLDLKAINDLSRSFNPWYQRLALWLSDNTPSFQLWSITYVDEDEYVGPDRRRRVRQEINNIVHSVRIRISILMLPRTKKITHIDKAG